MKNFRGNNSSEILTYKCEHDTQECGIIQQTLKPSYNLSLKAISVLQQLSRFKLSNLCFLKILLPEYKCCELRSLYKKIVKINKSEIFETLKHNSIERRELCNIFTIGGNGY